MSASYDGPGVYSVTIEISGHVTVEVAAASADEAKKQAKSQADLMDADIEMDYVSEIELLTPTLTGADVMEDAHPLTSLEEAVWALTGKVPPEAVQRINLLLTEERRAS